MEGSTDLKVSDQEREAAALKLREHFAAGRLTEDELNERVQVAYSARAQQELQSLLSDLPALPVSSAQVKAEMAERRRHLQRRLIQESGGGVVAFVVCVIVWAANGAQSSFWPGWVALVVLIPLLRNGWRLYGPAPQFDRVERELERRSHHGRHHHRRRRG